MTQISNLEDDYLPPGMTQHEAAGHVVTVKLTKMRDCPVGFFAYRVRASLPVHGEPAIEVDFIASVMRSSVPDLASKAAKLQAMREDGVRRVLEMAAVAADDDGIPFEGEDDAQ